MNKRKETILAVIGIIVLVLAVIGVSYAAFSYSNTGEKLNSITTGAITMSYTESDNIISITNALPTTDATGKKRKLEGEYFDFTVSTTLTGGTTLNWEIAAEDIPVDEKQFSGSNVKFYLTKVTGDTEEEVMAPRVYSEEIEENEITGRPANMMSLLTGTTNKSETTNYRLRLYVDENYNPQDDGGNLVFQVKINVYGKVESGVYLNEPALDSGMIAVTYNGSSWVKADTSSNWYNYDNGEWANAVTVSAGTRDTYQSAAAGTEINMNDIETMWVWIPRYSYTMGSEDGTNYYGKQGTYLSTTPTRALPGEIDIKFIDTNTKEKGTAKYKVSEGIQSNNWYTPDAFTFGEEELSGIWVGKFETSSSNPSAANGGGNVTNLDPMIKPNVTSWRGINVSNAFTVSQKMNDTSNRYGLSETVDTHMMKNSEWGVVAYLSQSRYGKLGNKNFTGANKEIYQNKSDRYITGCSYGSPSNGNTDYGCQYTYDNNIRTETGESGKGVGASTTGTIYGIYDMSGGAWEYVMGNYNDVIGSSGFLSMPEAKYYNKYTSDDPLTACNGSECLSHSLSETAGWYNDAASMVSAEYPWLLRSGGYNDTTYAGVFYFGYTYTLGGPNSSDSFRLVMSVR